MKVIYNDRELDPAALLLGLYQNTRAVGMGTLHDDPDFSLEDAAEVISDKEKTAFPAFSFDYVCGRPIKIVSTLTGVIEPHSIRNYERDAGEGAFQRAVDFALTHSE